MRNCAGVYFVTLLLVSPWESPKLFEENDVFEALSAAGSNESPLNDIRHGLRIQKMSYLVGLSKGKTLKWRKQKNVKGSSQVKQSCPN